jgi:hypothetical protein
MKKIVLTLLVTAFSSSLAHAIPPPRTMVVYGHGYVEEGVGEEVAKAKALAIQDARRQCGSENIFLAENLGWEIKHNEGINCQPRRFCNPEPASVSVKGVFICLDNIPKP